MNSLRKRETAQIQVERPTSDPDITVPLFARATLAVQLDFGIVRGRGIRASADRTGSKPPKALGGRGSMGTIATRSWATSSP